jgi:hypothetical protein
LANFDEKEEIGPKYSPVACSTPAAAKFDHCPG